MDSLSHRWSLLIYFGDEENTYSEDVLIDQTSLKEDLSNRNSEGNSVIELSV